MPHLNFWGYDASTLLLPDYEQLQMRDAQGRAMGWPGLLRTGATNRLAYMRVDDERWQAAFLAYVEPLLTELGVEALFLDQIGMHGHDDPSFRDATLAILSRLRKLNPRLVLGGEILADFLVDRIDLFQVWGQAWCGVEMDLTDVASPLLGWFYRGRVRLLGHLGLPAATPCRYCWTNYPFIVEHGITETFRLAQDHSRLIGTLPHVRLNYREHGLDRASRAVIESAG